MKLFKECHLIKKLNKICEPISRTYLDLLQGTLGVTISDARPCIKLSHTHATGNFPYLGKRHDVTTMFTIDYQHNVNNPGRLDQQGVLF